MTSGNRRIARNTLMLYIRMLLSMAVSLYTSRVVLGTLGVTDYGIYGVVGGVVGMFSFLNASMSGATSRFLTFEMGRGDTGRLKETFSSALIVHAGIALVVLLLAETVGLWLLMHKLVIPPDRLTAAHWVYQLSILSMAVSVTQVPYNASIIAHEKMDVYAYVEIANVTLKLLIVYLLTVGPFDKLIFYAGLVLAVSVVIALTYRIYCVRHFSECRFHFVWRPAILRPLLSFSGWDLYGNMSVMAREQGVNILLNMFFGPVLNAASGIATQVQGAVSSFVANIVMAARPQIIKSYAAGDISRMLTLIHQMIRLNFLLLLLLTVPILTELDFILKVWLRTVPQYAVIFCQFTLLFNFFSNMSFILVTGLHAAEKIKRPSLINGTLYLLVLPATYLSFRMDGASWFPYLFNVVAVFLGMLSNAWSLRLHVPQFSFRTFLVGDLLPCLGVMAFTLGALHLLSASLPQGWLRLVLVTAVSTLLLLFIGWTFFLPAGIRSQILQRLKNRFS